MKMSHYSLFHFHFFICVEVPATHARDTTFDGHQMWRIVTDLTNFILYSWNVANKPKKKKELFWWTATSV